MIDLAKEQFGSQLAKAEVVLEITEALAKREELTILDKRIAALDKEQSDLSKKLKEMGKTCVIKKEKYDKKYL